MQKSQFGISVKLTLVLAVVAVAGRDSVNKTNSCCPHSPHRLAGQTLLANMCPKDFLMSKTIHLALIMT